MARRDRHAGGFEIEHRLDIDGDIATVFAFLTDPATFRLVDPALVAIEPMTPLALGTAGRMTHRRSGLTARTTWTVTACEPPRGLTVTIRGSGYAMTESAALEPTPGGTRIRFVDRVWPTTLAGRLLVALSGGIMRRDLEARAARLAAALAG